MFSPATTIARFASHLFQLFSFLLSQSPKLITLMGCRMFIQIYETIFCLFKSEVTNMRPAKEFPAAREHFGETYS